MDGMLEQITDLESVFLPTVIARLDKHAMSSSRDELKSRIQTLGATRISMDSQLPFQFAIRPLLRKIAWDTYVSSAAKLGMLEGIHGSDIVARLRSPEPDAFRGAMAECFCAWFLASRHGFSIKPKPNGGKKSVLEFLAEKDGLSICVEVKAPYRQRRGAVWRGNDADLLESCLIDANKQFRDNSTNLLVIVPDVTPAISTDRYQILEAFYGREVIVVPVDRENSGRPVSDETHTEFRPVGRLIRPGKADRTPAYTRVSSIIILEDHLVEAPAHGPRGQWRDARTEPYELILHNPNAKRRVPPDAFPGAIQFIEENRNMRWTDGHRIGP